MGSCRRGKKRLRRIRAFAEKLKVLPELDEDERLLYAEHFLMTPDERWLRNYRYIQLVNSSDALGLESLIRSKEASGRPTDLAQLPLLRECLASRRVLER